MMVNINTLHSRLKTINPKNKKKLKFYKDRIKVQVASKDSNYKRNWYICNDEFFLSEKAADDFLLLESLSENDVDLFTKNKSLYVESLNRFFLQSYKSNISFNSILTLKNLHNVLYKNVFFNDLSNDLVLQSVFFISFISEDRYVLNELTHMKFTTDLDFTSIYKLESDFYLRNVNIYDFNQLLELLELKEFYVWFSSLKKLNVVSIIHYNSSCYDLDKFLQILFFYLNLCNHFCTKQKVEVFDKSEFFSIINMFFEDPDNLMYKDFELDLYKKYQKRTYTNVMQHIETFPSELDLKYVNNVELVDVFHTNLQHVHSIPKSFDFLNSEFEDVIWVKEFLYNLKNEL